MMSWRPVNFNNNCLQPCDDMSLIAQSTHCQMTAFLIDGSQRQITVNWKTIAAVSQTEFRYGDLVSQNPKDVKLT